jgi:hypothetical protein
MEMAGGKREEQRAIGNRQSAIGNRQKAKGKRQKAKGKRQKAKGKEIWAAQGRILISKIREPTHHSPLTTHTDHCKTLKHNTSLTETNHFFTVCSNFPQLHL